MQATWMPYTEEGVIHNRAELPESVFAFPQQRKEPLTDASHVINALARFDQVEDVSDADRDLAFANIKKAALVMSRGQPRAGSPAFSCLEIEETARFAHRHSAMDGRPGAKRCVPARLLRRSVKQR